MQLGLREANQQFSKAIKEVRAGREVVLTDRGRPIAVIKPIRMVEGQEVALRELQSQGLITRPARAGRMPTPRWKPIVVKGRRLSQSIIDDREERA
jgi:prevent-host-death family protein